jgi:tRNA-specific 2-thiouridylase
MDKVVVGFSGGVESAVSARLLRERGLEVVGLFLDTGGASAEEARALAEAMGVPLTVIDAREAMEEHVCRPFTEAYLRGVTPNPCVLCNPAVKFRFLEEYADKVGAAYMATGHYARAEGGSLYKGAPVSDQSYMLYRLSRKQVSRLLLPLGSMEKTQVRAFARNAGLPVHDKPDSMEICFIPDRDYAGYIERRGTIPPPGNFVYQGRVVGRHRGIHHYTVGQRRHFGVYVGHRVYVSEIRTKTNEVILSDVGDLYAERVLLRDVNWLEDRPESPFACTVRVRHSRTVEPAALVRPLPEGGAEVTFVEPARAPAKGQSAVFYKGDLLLGGGFIV